MTAVALPDWFDRTKTAHMPDTPHTRRVLEDGRDALLKLIAMVETNVPKRIDLTGPEGAVLVAYLSVLKGTASALGGKPLARVAEAMRRHVADKLGNKPSRDKAPRDTLMAELLAECERTRVALLACRRASAEA